jgi:Fic/DOC family
MHPNDCESWEYKDVANHKSILMAAAKKVYKDLRKQTYDSAPAVSDSRGIHCDLFCDLVPAALSYLAGHYRGENYRCLKYCPVSIPSDPRVGCPPEFVFDNMALFAGRASGVIAGLDAAFKLADSLLCRNEKMRYAVIAVCKIFVDFLTIHPYANGNGHIARFFVTAILGRYDIWTKTFPIEPRPPDPPYSDLISAYRSGCPLPLEQFIFQCLLG